MYEFKELRYQNCDKVIAYYIGAYYIGAYYICFAYYYYYINTCSIELI
jgi:hypothetical protein